MLYPTTTFEPADRDTDGLYSIGGSHIHVFPFQVPYAGQQLISMRHAFPGSQDSSLRVSFTSEPLDTLLFPTNDNWDYFPMSRADRVCSIWANGSPEMEDSMYLDPTKTYYLNVQNLQNQANGYILTFSFLN